MEIKNNVIIKCRGIIVCEDKFFVVKHGKHIGFYALPGGHLELSETPEQCIEREMVEEFGIKAEVGKLAYINTFKNNDGTNYIEFIFEIKNGKDYLDIEKLKVQKEEIFDILWVGKNENLNIMPEKIYQDFNDGTIFSGNVQFIK
jgi:8-oxo-dGTP pyrophosphatase MutT (NUDIX family)